MFSYGINKISPNLPEEAILEKEYYFKVHATYKTAAWGPDPEMLHETRRKTEYEKQMIKFENDYPIFY